MKGNKYIRQVEGFPEPWCDHCRIFVTDLKKHYHDKPKVKETVTTNERLLEIIRASF